MTDQTTAMAYAENGTDAQVIVHGDLGVGPDDPVEIEILPGGRGDWTTPGVRLTVRRIQLGHIRLPGRDDRAHLATWLAMIGVASAMTPASGSLRASDPVAYWNLRTSMDDLRAALCVAAGVPVVNIRRDGYDISATRGRVGRRAASGCRRHFARAGLDVTSQAVCSNSSL